MDSASRRYCGSASRPTASSPLAASAATAQRSPAEAALRPAPALPSAAALPLAFVAVRPAASGGASSSSGLCGSRAGGGLSVQGPQL